ncbi:hypothetical protein RB653_008783 [Dictyostelium firmibasis]|uniref:SH3 domain-containing protein n=1 Tax=Dictyostelium firmibasis TaxID=79012 RepID=A0AAN7TTA5_9MYCE
MSSKEKTSWGSIKTNFARTKHKVLASFGAAETTVDSKIVTEKEKLFTLFKLMKRLNKNVDKYEATLKEINILQNEISHDLLALNENDPAIKTYQEVATSLEQERIRIEEILENYYHDPLRIYLSQFRDIRSRLEELDLRRLDMDRYYRDYNIKANKGKDASSLQKTENKHTKTKEAYQELSDEIMRDMYALFDDRKLAFDPAFACFINRNNEYFARAASEYQGALGCVQNINELEAVNHPQAITPVESSSMSRNVRSSTVFTSPKDYSSNGSSTGSTPTQRPRASTIATTSPPSSYDNSPYQNTTTTTTTTTTSNVNLSKPSYGTPSPQQQYTSPHQQHYPPQQQQPTHDEVPYSSPHQQQQPSINLHKSPVNTSPVNSGGSGRPLPTPAPSSNAALNKPRSTTMASGRPLPTPAPAPAPTTKRVQALYDFQGQDSSELSFRKGDMITVFKQNGEWYEAELNGVKGLAPCNYTSG